MAEFSLGEKVTALWGVHGDESCHIVSIETHLGTGTVYYKVAITSPSVFRDGLILGLNGNEIRKCDGTIADEILSAKPPITAREWAAVIFRGWVHAYCCLEREEKFLFMRSRDALNIAEAMLCGELEDERERE